MKKLSDKFLNPDLVAEAWYIKFMDDIQASKERIIQARKEWNKELIKDQEGHYEKEYDYSTHKYMDYFVKPKRLKEKQLIIPEAFYTFVSEHGYQVIPLDSYLKLSKAVKSKLDAYYILY